MKKLKPIAAMIALAFTFTSCEKMYTCSCSVPGKVEKEAIQVDAWTEGRAEVKCAQNNTAGPTNAGYYNCSLTATD